MNSAPSPSYGDVPPNPSSLSQDSADDVFLAGPHQPTRAQARLSIDKKSRPLAARVAPMKPSMKRHRCPTPQHLARLTKRTSPTNLQATHSQEEDDECLASFSFRSCSESGGILSGSDSTTATDLEGSAQSPRRRSPTPHNNNTATPSVAGDTFDPELVRLFQVLRASEASSSINSNYLSTNHSPAHVSNNAFIDATIRSMCVSWMVEVAAEFELSQHTLHLSIASLDRFLSTTRAVPRSQLQLIAVACLLVAAKHEEEMHPSVADLAAMAAHSFTAEDLLRMEALLLTSLKFCLAPPTSYTFLSVFKGLFSLRPQVFSLAAYYLEISMMEYSLLKISPSLLAAGAVVLAAGHYGDGVVLRALGKLIPGINIQVGPCLGSLQRVAETVRQVSTTATGHTIYAPVVDKFQSEVWHRAALVAMQYSKSAF
ncbi:putative Cyclin-A1-2 [Nannochloris sp. 'desiccata']|nr:putative Cyclin-A1-2 [Chlorella desiccata (nom. nud.)]